MSVEDGDNHDLYVQNVKKLFLDDLGLVPNDDNRAYTTFLIKKKNENKLSNFLIKLEGLKEKLHVVDIQISQTTLEEVFLNIAKEAEIKALKKEGKNITEIQLEDGNIVNFLFRFLNIKN